MLTLATKIWEGTVSVMAEDVVRVLVDKRIGSGNVIKNVFTPWAESVLSSCAPSFEPEIQAVRDCLDALHALTHEASKEDLLYRGRRILDHIEVVVCSCLLMYDATVNSSEVATAIASRWVRSKTTASIDAGPSSSWKKNVKLDKAIFLGEGLSTSQQSKL
jgi:hypothetical protein